MHDIAEVVHRHLVAHPGLHVIEDLIVLELVSIEVRRPVSDRLEARDEGDEDKKHGKHDAEQSTKVMTHKMPPDNFKFATF